MMNHVKLPLLQRSYGGKELSYLIYIISFTLIADDSASTKIDLYPTTTAGLLRYLSFT